MKAWRMALFAACACLAWAPSEAADDDRIDVDVSGIDGALRDNVFAILSLQRHSKSEQIDENIVGRLVQRAPGEVRTALRPFGYYEPKTEITLLTTPTGWNAKVHIDPG